MAGHVRALLVGVDQYLPPVRPLAGCANDVDAMERTLRSLVGDRLDPVVILNRDATRERLVELFRSHLGAAGPDDVALFYFSGHGSYEPAPEEFWDVEPDRRNETLVCVDSRTPGKRDLADKELAALVSEVSDGGAHVLVILDCCHSGSGVRGDEEVGEQRVRQAPGDDRPRSLDSYAVPVRLPGPSAGTPGGQRTGSNLGATAAPAHRGLMADSASGRYVLLAACESRQTAKEQPIGGVRRGVFTASLESSLRSSGGSISYADLLGWVTTRVKGLATAQTPQLEVVVDDDRSAAFLGGGLEIAPHHVLTRHADGWAVDVGAMDGVPHAEGAERITFAVHPAGSDPGSWRDPAARVARAVVRRVEPDRSLVDLELSGGELDPEQRYVAVPLSWPIEAVPVRLEGDAAGVGLVRAALADALRGRADVVVVGSEEPSELVVRCVPEGFTIHRASDGRPATKRLVGSTEENAADVVRQLQHIARWRRLRDLAHPGTQLSAERVALEVTVDEQPPGGSGGVIRLEQPTEGPERPGVRVTVHNRGPGRVFVGILGLTHQFGVVNLMAPSPGEWVDAGVSFAVRGGKPIRLEVPDLLHAGGVSEVTDYVTLLASTEDFDAGRLTQPELDAPSTRGTDAPSLREVLGQVTRSFVDDADAVAVPDWTAQTRTVLVRRPLAGVAIGGGATDGGAVQVGAVSLTAPAGLSARARVVGVDTTARDLETPVPALLRELSVSSPVPLAGTRDAGDDSSVLELADVTGADAVGPDSPLVVRVPGRIADDESMVAVVWDGEFWIPVGHTADRAEDHTDLAIVTLPTTAAAGGATKDLLGSVAIVVRKLVGRRLGLSYPWPRLAVATVADGDVRYDADRDAVAAAVSRASSVLLYVHGIIGDTRGQVRHGAASGLDDLYDVVLAFDYENLHTRIEENADALEDALTAVGLGPGSGKVVDVVAHSMGGLVSRWFVERGRGREMVSRVVLAGTPSGGSPWSQIQDWATAALGIGLNGLGLSLAWPAAVVTGLAGLVERIDNSLDQMHVDSPFVSELRRLADPRIPYTVLIGDRSVTPDTATQSLLGRLRLRATDVVSALAFLGEPNDIAVTVTSATGLPAGRNPESAVVRLGCDHMTYFSTEAGQAALRAALGKER